MTDLQDAKSLVQAHYAALEGADSETVTQILSERMTADATWRGVHPWNEQVGPAGAAVFWKLFLSAFAHVQRREDIFFAGRNEIDNEASVWTTSMGHLMGLFDAPFLGIPATRKLAMLRYAEFNRVENGKIVETALFCDVLHLMTQAGLNRFPQQTAVHMIQPGPRTHDGLLMGENDSAEGAKTLALIDRMIFAISAANDDPSARTPREELKENWHDDMIWWGPDGVGATYTIDRYIEQHQGPFRKNITDRVFNGHVCRMAEGTYGGFFGWPNLTLTNAGAYMGIKGDPNVRADMRVVDIYRRDGEKLAENWIFIDVLHFLKMQGVDVLEELATR
ncbi:ester cyclase [Sulfitobacter aestuariivivens]|uniref:Ester cyclase n=1 Tax=Sulfitobacter aestuariivivens TaxID=2766981 RepID=A0A927HEA3_9RHOB|nr:ester cyclase [Sulfitobacter aestuariivivens]MBD3663173.1 ester cyclase [Sulfitobacter aestuariivivens]